MDQKVKKNYKNIFRINGHNIKSLQMSSVQSQKNRFKALCKNVETEDSCLDIGCGFGDLLSHLNLEKNFQGKYIGIDFVEEFIEVSKKQWNHKKNASFYHSDILEFNEETKYDHVLISGVFNNKIENNKKLILEILKKFYFLTNKSLSFNGLSTYVDYQDTNLYYMDPLWIFDWCKKNLTKKVTLDHSYLVKENVLPYEFTIHCLV